MRVMAIDPKDMERPAFVFSLDKPDKLMDLLPKADVVVLACPLTDGDDGPDRRRSSSTAMKPTAYLINVARGGLVQTRGAGGGAAEEADRRGRPGRDRPGAAAGRRIRCGRCPTCVISPHVGGQSPEASERQWRLFRENVRRFVAGEPLLCVVDKAKGY